MSRPARVAAVVLGLALIGRASHAQTVPRAGEAVLGRAHVWVEIGRIDFDEQAARAWGVNREEYLGVELWLDSGRGIYLGGGVAHAGASTAHDADGDLIRDFDFLSLELSGKKAIELGNRIAFDAGLGGALFYAGGNEVDTVNGREFTDPLADVGVGIQLFTGVSWRARRMLVGLDVKYQLAFDIIDVDYSNLRFGGHLGLVF